MLKNFYQIHCLSLISVVGESTYLYAENSGFKVVKEEIKRLNT